MSLKNVLDLWNGIQNPKTPAQKIISALWDTGKYGLEKHAAPYLKDKINPFTNKNYTEEELADQASEFATVRKNKKQQEPMKPVHVISKRDF